MVLADRFVAYGPSHWAALGLFAVGCVALVLLGRAQRKPNAPQKPSGEFGEGARGFGKAFALAIVYSMIGTHTYTLLPGHWSVGGAVPLELCDLAWPVAVWALWTFGHRAFAVLYYWGLTVSIQGLLTPAMTGQDYPAIRYLDFFGEHLLIVWAAVYLTWGVGMRPGWSSYRFAVAATAVWAATALVVNLIAGTDFGYLNHKPGTGSVLNLMGPWPWYILVEAALILTGWALITWPWVRTSEMRQRPHAIAKDRD